MSIGFDNYKISHNLLLSLPMFEATGVAADPTQDIAKPHHTVVLTGPPTWAQHALSDLGYMVFSAGDALTLAAAAVVPPTDMNFRTGSVTGGFSFAAWVYGTNLAAINTLFCYGGATDGYQINILATGEIQLVTYQAAANQITVTAAGVFTINNWQLLTVTCDGAWDTAAALIYQNAIDVTDTAGVHISPDTPAARDFYVGAHDDQAGPPGAPELSFIGNMWNPRCWSRQLPQSEILEILDCERHWFGV